MFSSLNLQAFSSLIHIFDICINKDNACMFYDKYVLCFWPNSYILKMTRTNYTSTSCLEYQKIKVITEEYLQQTQLKLERQLRVN
jgi:hypothetical protein